MGPLARLILIAPAGAARPAADPGFALAPPVRGRLTALAGLRPSEAGTGKRGFEFLQVNESGFISLLVKCLKLSESFNYDI